MMQSQYSVPMRCEVGGDVVITVLVTADNGAGCQIEMSEEPSDCSRREQCPGGSRCLLNVANWDGSFTMFDDGKEWSK